VFKEKKRKVKYSVGTMIEIPRAALRADEIAEGAEFFSFGTNDLTQTGFGLSRDDTGPVINMYVEKEIFPADPFVTIDREGVGELMRIGIERGRKTRPNIKLGICGEHAGEAKSVEFCHEVGLDYVSASPYRLPIARLAAAQAALKEKAAEKAPQKPAAKAAEKARQNRAVSASNGPRNVVANGHGKKAVKPAKKKLGAIRARA
jgi:pyruvate, orthophosphate dikinase